MSPQDPARATPGGESWFTLGWRRKGHIFLGLIIGVAVSAAVGVNMKRVYQSSAQISVIKKGAIDARPFGFDENVTPPQDLLKSPLLIERAIQSNKLGNLSLAGGEDVDVLDVIKQGLAVAATRGPSGQTPVYKLSFRSGDADESRVVLNAVIDTFKDFMDKRHQAVSEDTFELILREKQTLEKEIAAKDAEYRAFRAQAPLLGKGKDGLELRQDRLNSIQAKRSTLLLQRVELEGQLASVEKAREEGRSKEAILAMLADFARKTDPADLTRERPMNLHEQLMPLLLEERKLTEIHGAKHPEVIAVRKKIEIASRLLVLPPAAWHGQMEDVASGKTPIDPVNLSVQLLKQRLDHNKISEEMLAKVFVTEQQEARKLASYEIENDAYQTSIALNQKLYEALAKRLNEVSLVRSAGGYQVEILEAPAAGKKVAPSMVITVIIGAFAGLMLGLLLAWWREARATRSAPDAQASDAFRAVVAMDAGAAAPNGVARAHV